MLDDCSFEVLDDVNVELFDDVDVGCLVDVDVELLDDVDMGSPKSFIEEETEPITCGAGTEWLSFSDEAEFS